MTETKTNRHKEKVLVQPQINQILISVLLYHKFGKHLFFFQMISYANLSLNYWFLPWEILIEVSAE